MYIVPFFVTALRMPEYPFSLRYEKGELSNNLLGCPNMAAYFLTCLDFMILLIPADKRFLHDESGETYPPVG